METNECFVSVHATNYETTRYFEIKKEGIGEKVSDFIFDPNEDVVTVSIFPTSMKDYSIPDFLLEYGDWYIVSEVVSHRPEAR